MKKINSNLIKTLLLFTIGVFCFSTSSFSQNWTWAKGHGGVSSESGLVLCATSGTPGAGVAVAGTYSSATISFTTINCGVRTFVNSGGLDVFVLMYDSYGGLLCANAFGGSGDDIPTGITQWGGNTVVCGYYNSSTLNTQPSSTNTAVNSNSGTNDVFMICYNNTASFTPFGLYTFGGINDDRAGGVFARFGSNVFLTGQFTSPSFTVGTGTNYTVTNSNPSGTTSDVFIISFAALSGTQAPCLGKINTGGPNSDDISNGITISGSGALGITGSYASVTNTTIIGTATLTTYGGRDVFIASYNTSFGFNWARGIGGSSVAGDFAGGISSDGTNGLYITGSYNNSSMVIGTSTITNSGLSDCFIAKYNSVGTAVWANSINGSDVEYGNSIDVVRANGDVYVSGAFAGTSVTIGTNTLVNTNPGSTSDIYIAKYNTTGTPLWATNALGASSEISNGISSDYNGSIYTTGRFDISPTSFGTTTLTSNGNTDAFVSKIACGSITITASSNTICTGGSSTLTAIGATNYNWTGGATSTTSVCVLNNPVLPFVNITYTIGTCVNTTSFSITVNQVPTTSNAGSNQNKCISSPNATMTANISSVGTGSWTLISGLGTITTPTLQNTSVTGLGLGTNIFQWTISNPPCPASSSTVAINVSDIPSISNAGPSQTVCPSSSSITTAANTPTVGTGKWTLVSGSGVITNTASPVTTITGLGAGTNVFAWTISNPPCAASVSNLTVTVLTASLNAGSGFNLVCKQTQLINATTNPPSPTSVVWTPTTGLSNSTVLTPIAKGTGSNIIYTVTCVLSNGCVPPPSTVSVGTTTITVPNICQVTVDSLSVNNEIFWDKSLYPNADSFYVYRETTTSVYTKIGRIARTSLSMYVDTNRSIGPFNGNPNLTSYKYKLQYKDSCGALSPLSLWHQTIFIQDQLNGNFNWIPYSIEGTTITPVSSYNLKRRSLTTGTETLVVSTGTTLATDPAYASFWPTNVKWFVDATGFSCNVTAKTIPGNETMVLKAKTKSNQSNDKLFATGIASFNLDDKIKVYPNPANDVLNVDLSNLPKAETVTEIHNTLGQVVYETKTYNHYLVINTSSFAGGVYIVNIKQNGKMIAVKKVVIER